MIEERLRAVRRNLQPKRPYGDGVPGAPVTELEYTHAMWWYAVLEEADMATYS